ncbi:MAG: hypothetical protein U0269_35480 [Polyangiales bacterium]
MRARFAVSLFAVAALSGAQACVPQPNAQGAVTCGAGDICPAGFVCAFGHCCPADAGVQQCPQAQYVEPSNNGSLACNARGECPAAHGFTCRMGLACCAEGDGGTGLCAPGAPGAACTAGSSCDPFTAMGEAARCVTEVSPVISGLGTLGDAIRIPVPNGICSAPCDPSNIRACGASAYCMGVLRVPGQPANLSGICAARCKFPAGQPYAPCRSDRTPAGTVTLYSCYPLADGSSSTEGFCFPDCTRDDYCARLSSALVPLRCDPASHVCVSGAPMVRDR